MFVYVYEDGRAEWSRQLESFNAQKHDECRDMFRFYMLNGKLVYENLKGVNFIKEEENW